MIKLSICISTLNRALYIEETLDTIVPQLNENVELIIVDGGSSDNTKDVVKKYVNQNKYIHYFQEISNLGFDKDYDKAVRYAKGEFCWLMTDDDLLELNAVEKVLNKINKKIDLIVVNSKVMNANFSKVLAERQLNIKSDVSYLDKGDILIKYVGASISCICCIIIRRTLWISRNRKKFYGTFFIHVGVVLQSPLINNVLLISDPLILIRYGNASWTQKAFKIWNIDWPQLIWSFNSLSFDEKMKICRKHPYLRFSTLFYNKAMGAFGFHQLRTLQIKNFSLKFYAKGLLVCLIPGSILNLLFIIFFKLFRKNSKIVIHDLLLSRYNIFMK